MAFRFFRVLIQQHALLIAKAKRESGRKIFQGWSHFNLQKASRGWRLIVALPDKPLRIGRLRVARFSAQTRSVPNVMARTIDTVFSRHIACVHHAAVRGAAERKSRVVSPLAKLWAVSYLAWAEVAARWSSLFSGTPCMSPADAARGGSAP